MAHDFEFEDDNLGDSETESGANEQPETEGNIHSNNGDGYDLGVTSPAFNRSKRGKDFKSVGEQDRGESDNAIIGPFIEEMEQFIDEGGRISQEEYGKFMIDVLKEKLGLDFAQREGFKDFYRWWKIQMDINSKLGVILDTHGIEGLLKESSPEAESVAQLSRMRSLCDSLMGDYIINRHKEGEPTFYIIAQYFNRFEIACVESDMDQENTASNSEPPKRKQVGFPNNL